jgi:hypothetical protein
VNSFKEKEMKEKPDSGLSKMNFMGDQNKYAPKKLTSDHVPGPKEG